MNYPDLPKRKCFSENGESCYTEDDLYSFADATVALRTPTAERECSVPEGYRLVPVDATLDMSIAFAEAFYTKRRCIDDDDINDWWQAMLAAAPSSQEAEKETSGPLSPEHIESTASEDESAGLEWAARICEEMRPTGGRAWTEGQADCYEALTEAANTIRKAKSIARALALKPYPPDKEQSNG